MVSCSSTAQSKFMERDHWQASAVQQDDAIKDPCVLSGRKAKVLKACVCCAECILMPRKTELVVPLPRYKTEGPGRWHLRQELLPDCFQLQGLLRKLPHARDHDGAAQHACRGHGSRCPQHQQGHGWIQETCTKAPLCLQSFAS